MLSRSFAILLGSWLPVLALTLPLSRAHTINTFIAGTVATLLAVCSMVYDRARFGAAVVGAWVALTAFIFPSTLLEEVLVVCWGTMMFASIAGPFSEGRPRQAEAAPAKATPEELPEAVTERIFVKAA